MFGRFMTNIICQRWPGLAASVDLETVPLLSIGVSVSVAMLRSVSVQESESKL